MAKFLMTECLFTVFRELKYKCKMRELYSSDVILIYKNDIIYSIFIDQDTVGDDRYGKDIKYDLQNPNCDPEKMAHTILTMLEPGWFNTTYTWNE